MASGDFDIKIVGKGGPGGFPHLSVDPITMAANAINTLQTLSAVSVPPEKCRSQHL